jgi:toxin FitB
MTAGYLLDTNIISETRKKHTNSGVVAFLSGIDIEPLFVSTLTIGELYKGVELKRRTAPALADQLNSWVSSIETTFADRVLPIDLSIARLWGKLSARQSSPVIDTLIAATALAHNLVLVTRNIKDVEATGVLTINPWHK